MKLGLKIKKLRESKKLTQEQLGEQLHVTRQTISSWERNNSYPDVEMIYELAKVFDVSSDYLIISDYSRLKDLTRKHVRLIIAFVAILSVVITWLYYVNNYSVYKDKIARWEGVCTRPDWDYYYGEDFGQYVIYITVNERVEYDDTIYCVPVTFKFYTSHIRTYEFQATSIEVHEVEVPLNFEERLDYAFIGTNDDGTWTLAYRLSLGVTDDDNVLIDYLVRNVIHLDDELNELLEGEYEKTTNTVGFIVPFWLR